MKSEGQKDDDKKLLWYLLPIKPVEDIVRVLTYGAKKYSPDNWLRVKEPENRYYSAALRHLCAYKKGASRDKQSGRSHLAHAMCCLIFLWHFENERKSHARKTRKAAKKNRI